MQAIAESAMAWLLSRSALETHFQLKLESTRRAQGIHARAQAQPQIGGLRIQGAVGRSRAAVQNVAEGSGGAIEVGEIEDVEEGDTRTHFQAFFEFVSPTNADIEGFEPALSDRARGRQGQRAVGPSCSRSASPHDAA